MLISQLLIFIVIKTNKSTQNILDSDMLDRL